eukprot:scaffold84518_cov35-Tisochrysis_lutea.AAC.2
MAGYIHGTKELEGGEEGRDKVERSLVLRSKSSSSRELASASQWRGCRVAANQSPGVKAFFGKRPRSTSACERDGGGARKGESCLCP